MAKLADAQDSGSCGGDFVQVQVLSSAPSRLLKELVRVPFFCLQENCRLRLNKIGLPVEQIAVAVALSTSEVQSLIAG